MAKLHLDLKVSGSMPGAYEFNSAQIASLSGENLGNLVFRRALSSFVSKLNKYKSANYGQAASIHAEQHVDSMIVSCANWLGTRPEDEAANGNRANFFDAFNCPIISFGLGVQAKAGAKEVQLGKNSRRLARVLSKKAPLLSVRDEFTLQVLQSIGVNNAVVTGCPSNFINLEPELGTRIRKRVEQLLNLVKEWNDIRSCITEFSGDHPSSGVVVRKKLELLERFPAFYVVQSPQLLPFILGEQPEVPRAYRIHKPDGIDSEQIRALLRRVTLYFSSVESWLDFSRTCNLAFGMRIHGVMVPIQAGVPSILLAHDSRTQGLASVMGVPTLDPGKFVEIADQGPGSLLEIIYDQMASYDSRRKELARTMRNYIESNGLKPTNALLDLAA